MINFIERIKSYSPKKEMADMAMRAWKSAHEEMYADFCKRMDAVAKYNQLLSVVEKEKERIGKSNINS